MSELMADSQKAALLFLHAQTAIHPGSGTALGVVDLPVQRERHTQWPIIPGSSLKGVLRDCCRRYVEGERGEDADSDDALVTAFGPPTQEADKHAGALSLADARLLLFPVRSLRGVFAWVTCPAVLERLNRDLGLMGASTVSGVPTIAEGQVACAEGSPLLVDGHVVLEEFEFSRISDASAAVDWIASRTTGDPATQQRIRSHLAILSDDDFCHFVRHATEVVARIGLDYERKTVRQGALFYQEFLPAETVFYSVVLASKSRREGDGRSAREILDYVRRNTEQTGILQIGADETTGKGFCAVSWHHIQEG